MSCTSRLHILYCRLNTEMEQQCPLPYSYGGVCSPVTSQKWLPAGHTGRVNLVMIGGEGLQWLHLVAYTPHIQSDLWFSLWSVCFMSFSYSLPVCLLWLSNTGYNTKICLFETYWCLQMVIIWQSQEVQLVKTTCKTTHLLFDGTANSQTDLFT